MSTSITAESPSICRYLGNALGITGFSTLLGAIIVYLRDGDTQKGALFGASLALPAALANAVLQSLKTPGSNAACKEWERYFFIHIAVDVPLFFASAATGCLIVKAVGSNCTFSPEALEIAAIIAGLAALLFLGSLAVRCRRTAN
jgi:hypothetical protein